jgi:2-succinyl-5-enolpyruvyl-6-hydroxy-3-cyclohexene-1-carboxylate synthase
MRHFLINDERCGAFAAETYARVTNRPGICDGTLGPGATNLVTGLIEALNAGTPVVAIAGDTNRAYSSKNMTQECRQVEILRPAVKELIRVEQTSAFPSCCAALSRSRPRADQGRFCSMCPRTSVTASTISPPRILSSTRAHYVHRRGGFGRPARTYAVRPH